MLKMFIACTLLLNEMQPEKAALVLEIVGPVRVRRGDGDPRLLGPRHIVFVEDHIDVGDMASVVLVFLQDYHLERLSGKTQAKIGKDRCNADSGVERMSKVERPAIRNGLKLLKVSEVGGVAIMRSIPIMKPPTKLQIQRPAFGTAVLTCQPAFSWTPVQGANNYDIQLVSASNHVVWKTRTTEPRSSYPAEKDREPLRPGRDYRWTVTANLDSGEALTIVQSKFSVLPSDDAQALAELEADTASESPVKLLLAAIAYQNYAAFDHAIATLEKLTQIAPHEPEYYDALADCYLQVGQTADAQTTRAKAEKLGLFRPTK